MKRLISFPHSHSDLYEWLRKVFFCQRSLWTNLMHPIWHLGREKWNHCYGSVFFFFFCPLSGGLLLFVIWRQEGTRENTVISFPPPRRHSCSVSTKQDVYLKTPPKSCHPAQRGISYLFMYSLRACERKKRRQTDIEMTHACICVHVGSILRWNAALFLRQ